MSFQILINGVLLLALVGWMGYRQLTWRVVSVSRMWRLPIILAVVGLFMIAQSVKHVSGLDISILLIELVISLGIGAVMGTIAVFRRRMATADDIAAASGQRRASTAAPLSVGDMILESRTGWWGLGLWVIMIAVRVGMDVGAAQLGSVLASSTGVILLMVAANRLARTAVFAYRVERNAVVAA